MAFDTRTRRAEAAPAFRKFGCDAKKSNAVRCLGELPNDLAWGLECLVCIPERAGGSVACELQFCRAVAFGDVPGAVQSGEENGNALRALPLKRRQAMSNLLQACAEPGGEQFEIVPQLSSGLQESLVR